MRFFLAAALVTALLQLPLPASAHLDLTWPTSRYGPEELKPGPCGLAGGERSGNVTYFEAGETIDVRWDEYVDHPSHYRIAFDADGDDDFVDPPTMMDFYTNDAVLLDNIADKGPGDRYYSATVTLPEITCDNCTLQVIQVMYDKAPPYTTPGDDIYYQCADLVLGVGGAAGGGTGCSASRSRSGFSLGAFLLLFVAWRLARMRRLPV